MDVQNNDSLETRKRVSYPAKTHKEMISWVEVIYNKLGSTGFHTNKDIAAAHDLVPDSIKYQLTAAQQYGLLRLKHGQGYSITDLFKSIHHSVDAQQKQRSIIDSLRTADIYKDIFAEYENHVLPQMEGIKNFILRKYELKENVAKRAAKVLFDNLNDYSLLNTRGALILSIVGSHGNNDSLNVDAPRIAQNPKDTDTKGKDGLDSEEEQEVIEIPIPMKNKKLAYLTFPVDYTDSDMDKIARIVQAYKDLKGVSNEQ